MLTDYDLETLQGLSDRLWILCQAESLKQLPAKPHSPNWILEYSDVVKIGTLQQCLKEVANPTQINSLANSAIATGAIKGYGLLGNFCLRWNPNQVKKMRRC